MNWLFYIIFNFIIYSFFGWVLEEGYSFFTNGYFKEEGFLSIPFKPMYGIAMCILVFSFYKLDVNKLVLLIMCAIIPTIIEYFSGYLLKSLFNEQYWSYSSIKYNYQGLICLKFSICWTILSFIMVRYIQPFINNFYKNYSSFNNLISIALLLYILFDLSSVVIDEYKEKMQYNIYEYKSSEFKDENNR